MTGPAVDPHRTPAEPDSRVSLAEYVVLGLVAEGSPHGFAVARVLAPGGDIGRVYSLARPAVYRAIDRLSEVGLIEALEVQPGDRGPKRTPVRVTAAGGKVLEAWLARPVEHIRDLRTEFLVKLAVLQRSNRDAADLVARQTAVLEPIVTALAARERSAQGFDRTVAQWRLRSGQAALRFLEDVGRGGTGAPRHAS